jgi:hypothetical protein
MDVISNQFIFYHLTLPIHWHWIFVSYALSFIVEVMIISLPVMTLGIFFLKQYVSNIQPIWHLFAAHYSVALIFIATFFLSVIFRYHYSWIENNLWPRRLLPMFSLGATNTTWYQILAFSPFLAYIGLANPLTYFAEGFRASLLSGEYIPFSLSLSMLFLFSLGNIYLLLDGIKKQIDPVS